MLKSRAAFLLVVPAGLVLAAFAPERAPVSVPVGEDAPILAVPAPVQLTVASSGNEVRYLVREQLVGRDLPNDAVGVTPAVTGSIVLDDAGNVVPAQSRLVVDITGLTSDSERRDGYVQRRLLESETHPTVTLAPTAIRGLTGAVPTSGTASLQIVGDLTVKGVTRPTTWNVDARFEGNRITGSARTAFTFDDFELTQPRVSVVLSVADTIRLEYDFALDRSTP